MYVCRNLTNRELKQEEEQYELIIGIEFVTNKLSELANEIYKGRYRLKEIATELKKMKN